MAWTKSAWQDIIGTDASKASVAHGSTTTGTIDCNGANPYITLGVKVVVVFGTTPDDDVTVEFLHRDADDAAEDDTIPIYEAAIPEVSTSEERATYQLNVSALDTVKVRITNNDSADAVSVWVEGMGGYA